MYLSSSTKRALAISAMSAPVSFVSLACAATLLTPDYNPIRETVSRLASHGQPYWWLVSASFVIYSLLIQALGPLLYGLAPSRIAGGILWLLVVQYGSGAILAALYRVGDHTPALGPLTGDDLHHLGARAGFLAILALCFATPLAMRSLPGWRRWRTYSVGLGLLTVAFLIPFQTTMFPDINGLLQRGFFATTLLWVFWTSARIYRVTATPSTLARSLAAAPR